MCFIARKERISVSDVFYLPFKKIKIENCHFLG